MIESKGQSYRCVVGCVILRQAWLWLLMFGAIVGRADEPQTPQDKLPQIVKPAIRLGDGKPVHKRNILSVAIADNGSLAASDGCDGTVRVWDLRREGRLVGEVKQGFAGGARSLSFSPKIKTLALIHVGSHLHLWDIGSKKLDEKDTGDWRAIRAVSFSSDGTFLATAEGLTGQMSSPRLTWRISIWDPLTGKIRHTLRQQEDRINDIAISSDGKLVASADEEGIIRVWSIPENVKLYESDKREGEILSVAFSPRAKALIAANSNGKIYFWSTADWKTTKRETLHGLTGYCVAFLDETRIVVSGGKDGVMSVWEVPRGRELLRLIGHKNYVQSVAVAPSLLKLVSGDWDGNVNVWELDFLSRNSK